MYNLLKVFIAVALGGQLALFAIAGLENKTSSPALIPFGEMQKISNLRYNPIVRMATLEGRGFCTGWVIDKRYAVTAAHCINKNGKVSSDPIRIFSDSGLDTTVVAQAVSFDERTDLGLIHGDFSTIQPIKANFTSEGFSQAKVGKYVTCGFPFAQKRLFCTQFIPTGYNFFAVEGYGHLIPGMSGGPVINMNTGEAVAVNSAVYQDKSLVSPILGLLGLFGIEQ